MPRKRETIRRTPSNDIEAVRAAIRAGAHLLPTKEEQLNATRFLTDTQQALLGHLCPTYQSLCKFLSHCRPDPELLKAARRELRADVERAEVKSANPTPYAAKRKKR